MATRIYPAMSPNREWTRATAPCPCGLVEPFSTPTAVARKGSQVRVAAGRYRIETPHEIFHLTSGILDVRGGFSRFDHFLTQAPGANPTTLVGVPAEFRDQLRAQGFHVIADRKGGDHQGALADLRLGHGAMLASDSTKQCDDGSADAFPCQQIDMLSHLALADFSFETRFGERYLGVRRPQYRARIRTHWLVQRHGSGRCDGSRRAVRGRIRSRCWIALARPQGGAKLRQRRRSVAQHMPMSVPMAPTNGWRS